MMPFFAISITPNHIVINENEKPSHIWRGSLNRMEPKSSPEELIQKFKEISKDEYSKISASDDERLYVVSDPAGEGHPYTLYEFNIKYKGNITLIWEGYGAQPYRINMTRYARLYLWNHSKNEWNLIVNCTSFNTTENFSTFNTADKTLLFNLSTTSSCYVKDNYMYLLAIGPYGEGYSGGILATDYVAIKHKAVPEKFSLWLYLIMAVAILILFVVVLFRIRRK